MMPNRLSQLFSRRSAPRSSLSSEPLALYWDGADTFVPLTMKHSNWVEQEGPYTSLGNWMRPGSGGFQDLTGSDNGFTQAYLCCEWVFRAVNVFALKVAEIMRRGQVFSVDGSAQPTHAYLAAVENNFRLFDQKFYKEWMFSKILYGETFVELVPAVYPGTSIVSHMTALRLLNALYTEPIVEYGRITHYDYNDNEGRTLQLKPNQVVMDKRYNPLGELRGLSLLTAAMDAVNIDRTQVTVTRNFLKNNARPGLVFTLKDNKPLSPESVKEIQTIIKERAKGARNAGNNLMLPAAMDVTTVPAPTYTEGAALTDEQKRRICTATGIPAALVDFTDQAYQLSPVQVQNFYDLTLIPEAQEIAEVVDVRIMPSFDRTAKFKLPVEDIRGELGDPEIKTNNASKKFRDGAISVNEYRRATGEAIIPPEHDFYLFPVGSVVIPVNQIGNAPTLIAAARPQFPPVTGAPGSEVVHPELPETTANQDRGRGQGDQSQKAVGMITLPEGAVRRQGTPLAELKAWRKVALQRGARKAIRFMAHNIGAAYSDWIMDELDLIEDASDTTAIKALFEDAAYVLGDKAALKDYESTSAGFQTEVSGLIDAANKDESSRQAFAGGLRSALRRYGLMAFRDGMEDGGYKPESLSQDDLTIFRAWQAESSDYVTGIGAALFKDGDTPDPEMRSQLWVNKSLNDIYYAGLRIGAPTKQATWQLGGTIDHCDSCSARDGQKMTVDEWGKIGYPQDRRLDCGGWRCDCGLYDDDENRIGVG